MPLSIAICDDNETDLQYITGMVNDWAMQGRIPVSIRTFPSAESFLFHYSENKDYDILLLDVEMGNLNGIDLAKQIRTQNNCVQIVFITGYPDYIAEGYEVSALHYLMKPVKSEKLGEVLSRAADLSRKGRPYLLVFSERETIVKGAILYMSFTNSAGKKQQKIGNRFLSSKGSEHGFGLIRVDSLVAKNGGYLTRASEDGGYTTEVTLPL